MTTTGTSAETWSRTSAVSTGIPGNREGSNSWPTRAEPAGTPGSAVLRRATTSSIDALATGEQSTVPQVMPVVNRCMCGSTKPGMTVAPVSTTLVPGPTSPSRSLRLPTPTIRPPATATASAVGLVSSMVRTAPVRRRSALASGAAGPLPWWRAVAVRSAVATPLRSTRSACAGWGVQQPPRWSWDDVMGAPR